MNMGILTNDIKTLSDHQYVLYESQIDKYYQHKHNYDNMSLTDYIFKFYIQLDYRGAFHYDSKKISDINKYVENLYVNYCNHYCKDDCREITKQMMDDLMIKNYMVKHRTINYILYNEGISKVNIKSFIESCFNDMKNLPPDSQWQIDRIDIYIFVSQFIDYFISTIE